MRHGVVSLGGGLACNLAFTAHYLGTIEGSETRRRRMNFRHLPPDLGDASMPSCAAPISYRLKLLSRCGNPRSGDVALPYGCSKGEGV